MPSKDLGSSSVLKRAHWISAKIHFLSKLSVFALLVGTLQIFAISNSTTSNAAGVVGSAYLPAGSYLQAPSATTLGNGAFTIDVWFKTVDNPATSKFVLLGGTSSEGLAIYNGRYATNSATIITLDWQQKADIQFTVPTMSANTWYHLAASRSASLNWAVWLNGVRSTEGAQANSWSFLASTYAIGKWTSRAKTFCWGS